MRERGHYLFSLFVLKRKGASVIPGGKESDGIVVFVGFSVGVCRGIREVKESSVVQPETPLFWLGFVIFTLFFFLQGCHKYCDHDLVFYQ